MEAKGLSNNLHGIARQLQLLYNVQTKKKYSFSSMLTEFYARVGRCRFRLSFTYTFHDRNVIWGNHLAFLKHIGGFESGLGMQGCGTLH